MNKSILNLGKQLAKKEQKEIGGGAELSYWWNDPSISDYCKNWYRSYDWCENPPPPSMIPEGCE